MRVWQSGGNMVDTAPASGWSHMWIQLNLMRATASQLRHLSLTLGIMVSGSLKVNLV